VKYIIDFLPTFQTGTYSACLRLGVFQNCIRKPALHLYPFIFFLVFSASAAFADCTTNNVTITAPSLTFNQNSAAINAPLGNELISAVTTIATCTYGGWRNSSLSTISNKITTINGRYIYQTSNPGIGFAFAFEPTSDFCTSAGIMWKSATSDLCSSNSFTSDITLRGRYHLQFYKLANIASTNNVTISSSAPSVYLADYSGSKVSILTLTTFNVTVPTCNLTSASTTSVNLPKIYSNNLDNIGTAFGSTPFSITVNCPNPTNLNITFTDNNNIGQTGNYLTPLASSTAKGLGIQLKYNGNIISFGPDSAEPGTTNQIVLNGNLTSSQTFPFTASYVRTGTITPGTLSARATFTLSYQ